MTVDSFIKYLIISSDSILNVMQSSDPRSFMFRCLSNVANQIWTLEVSEQEKPMS